jgi:hypothetical protein
MIKYPILPSSFHANTDIRQECDSVWIARKVCHQMLRSHAKNRMINLDEKTQTLHCGEFIIYLYFRTLMYYIWQIMIYKSKIWTHLTGKKIIECHSFQTTAHLIYCTPAINPYSVSEVTLSIVQWHYKDLDYQGLLISRT